MTTTTGKSGSSILLVVGLTFLLAGSIESAIALVATGMRPGHLLALFIIGPLAALLIGPILWRQMVLRNRNVTWLRVVGVGIAIAAIAHILMFLFFNMLGVAIAAYIGNLEWDALTMWKVTGLPILDGIGYFLMTSPVSVPLGAIGGLALYRAGFARFS